MMNDEMAMSNRGNLFNSRKLNQFSTSLSTSSWYFTFKLQITCSSIVMWMNVECKWKKMWKLKIAFKFFPRLTKANSGRRMFCTWTRFTRIHVKTEGCSNIILKSFSVNCEHSHIIICDYTTKMRRDDEREKLEKNETEENVNEKMILSNIGFRDDVENILLLLLLSPSTTLECNLCFLSTKFSPILYCHSWWKNEKCREKMFHQMKNERI